MLCNNLLGYCAEDPQYYAPCMMMILLCCLQTETDFKAECMAGDTIESLASRVEEDTNGTGVVRWGDQKMISSL